jgi:hypothetical protein
MPPVAPTAPVKRSLALRAHKNSLFAAYYIDTTASTNATHTLVTRKVIPETGPSGVNSGDVHPERLSGFAHEDRADQARNPSKIAWPVARSIMLRFLAHTLLIGMILPIAACTFYSSRATADSQETVAAPKVSVPDQWLGKWIGPEGTFLVLSKSGENYTLQIQSLDGPNTYAGSPHGNSIEFVRDGKTETVHHGNGRDTGMKWLLDKNDCLVVKAGEGFCRD